jgi:chromosome segregation ATPase
MGDATATLDGYNSELSKCERPTQSTRTYQSTLRSNPRHRSSAAQRRALSSVRLRLRIAGIEELENKRKAISMEMDLEQQKKTDVQTQLRELTEKLSRINDSLGRKVSARNEYDTTIQETEAAYLKVTFASLPKHTACFAQCCRDDD